MGLIVIEPVGLVKVIWQHGTPNCISVYYIYVYSIFHCISVLPQTEVTCP